MYLLFGKRLLDILLAAGALLVLSPIMFFVAMAILAIQGRPIFFRQERPGLKAKPFTMVKFCTMTNARGDDGAMLSDAQRLTRLGGFLRSSSLDELPELWNILKGEMSLVGPRPLLLEYLSKYSVEQMRRHEVRPGVTGWAQVHGRQNLLFSKRMDYDVWYADNCSFVLDLKIILMTVVQVFVGHGVVLGQEVEDVDDIGLSRSIENPVERESQGS